MLSDSFVARTALVLENTALRPRLPRLREETIPATGVPTNDDAPGNVPGRAR